MKQKSLSKFSLSRPVRWTELLEYKQYAKLGGVDTSQTYLLFQTLLILFWPHSCMIWTKLTRTDAVFSRAACMVLLCAGKWIFRCLRKFQEKSQKIHAPKGPLCQKWGQRAARGPQAPCWRGPTPGRAGGAAWGAPTSSGALLGLLFILPSRKPWFQNPFLQKQFRSPPPSPPSFGGPEFLCRHPAGTGKCPRIHLHRRCFLPPWCGSSSSSGLRFLPVAMWSILSPMMWSSLWS